MKGKTGNEELTMVEKHKIIKKFSKEYNRSGKKGKGEILGMVVRVTGYNRVYASYSCKGIQQGYIYGTCQEFCVIWAYL